MHVIWNTRLSPSVIWWRVSGSLTCCPWRNLVNYWCKLRIITNCFYFYFLFFGDYGSEETCVAIRNIIHAVYFYFSSSCSSHLGEHSAMKVSSNICRNTSPNDRKPLTLLFTFTGITVKNLRRAWVFIRLEGSFVCTSVNADELFRNSLFNLFTSVLAPWS